MARKPDGTEVFGGSTVDVWWGAADATAPALPTGRANLLDHTDIDDDVWTSIGAGFIDEDGFNVDFQNTINKVFVLRSTAAQRVYRTQEEPMITFNLFEGTVAGMGVAMHGTSADVSSGVVDTSSAGDGHRRVTIMRGSVVRDAAILWRAASPADNDPDTNNWMLQGYIPRGVFTQVGSFKYYKEQIALPLTFEALESTVQTGLNKLGWIDVQGEAP